MIKNYAYLLEQGHVTYKNLQKALSISQETGQSVEWTLINNFKIPGEAVGKSLSNSHNCQFVGYDPQMAIATELFSGLHKSRLLNDCWVPLNRDENGIRVLIDDPSYFQKKAIIEAVFETDRIIFAVGIREDIEAFVNQAFDQIEIYDLVSAAESGERPIDVKKIVDVMFSEAYRQGASDINFRLSELNGKDRVLFRMNGDCREYMAIPDDICNDIVKRIKLMANLDVEDGRLPKIGYIKFYRDCLPVFRLSVTTLPTEDSRELVALKLENVGDSAKH